MAASSAYVLIANADELLDGVRRYDFTSRSLSGFDLSLHLIGFD
jgi:hypothetical protein